MGLEAYYHSIFYVLMNVLGFEIYPEVSSSRGRADAVLELGDKVYVMELKYVSCPTEAGADEKVELCKKALDEAMNQIKDRGYTGKYRSGGKAVYLAAIAFLGRGEIEMRTELDE